jgi:hypothetical protein
MDNMQLQVFVDTFEGHFKPSGTGVFLINFPTVPELKTWFDSQLDGLHIAKHAD